AGTGSPIDALIAGLSSLRLARRRRHAWKAGTNGGAGDDLALGPAAGEPGAPELVWTLVGLVAAASGRRPADALAAPSVASGVQLALGAQRSGRALIEATLVLCADHELNASSFAARVAASTGADLEACVIAALATFTGPRHGAESLRVQALLDEA